MASTILRAIVARLALLTVRLLAWARPLTVQLGSRRYLIDRNGRMLPVIAGGAPDHDGSSDSDGDDGGDGKGTETASGDGDDAGDGDEADDATADDNSKRDENWKAQSRKHEREAKRARKEAEELRGRLAKIEDASKTEQQRAIEQARKEADATARSEVADDYRSKILKAEIRAHAAGKFADTDDAIRLVDLEDDDAFNDDGDVQADVIRAALDDLLERKPHLRAGEPAPRRPSGDADAGKGSEAGADDADMNALIRRQRGAR